MTIQKSQLLISIISLLFAILLCEFAAQLYINLKPDNFQVYRKTETQKVTTNSVEKLKIHPFWAKSLGSKQSYFGKKKIRAIKQMVTDSQAIPEWFDIGITNNHGFMSNIDYPIERHDNQIIVAVVGGSVANWFSLFEGQRLVQTLESLPQYKGMHVKLMNLASPGFKQPQQLIILNYFLMLGQKFDIILNIDGFNEAALSWSENVANKIDISMPRKYPSSLKVLLRDDSSESILWIAKKLTLENQLDSTYQSINKRSSGLLYLFDKLKLIAHQENIDTHLNTLPSGEASNYFFHLPHPQTNDNQIVLDQIVEQWFNASQLIHSIAKDQSIQYLHILQPNQYYTNRQFNQEEKQIAFHKIGINAFSHPIKTIYPKMQEKLKTLQKQGFPIINGLDIFDDELLRVYADSCCHYTDVGNRLLTDFIIKNL